MIKAFILSIFLTLFLSCHKEIEFPEADFEVPAGTIKAGVPATFKNTSRNASAYEWDFGDSSTIVTSSDVEIIHNFKIGGDFNVRLIAKNGGGSNGISKIVKVDKPDRPLPKAIFELDPAIECPAPCTVSITNTSINSTSYTWFFGDNTPFETRELKFNRTLNDARSYAITLIAKANGLPNDTLTKTLKVTAPQSVQPTAEFDISGENCTYNCDVTFTNKSTSGITYLWNFGDGGLSTNLSPKHNYKRAGAYNVILVTRNGNLTSMKRKIVQIYAKCKFTKQTRQHPISGIYEALFSYDANDFPLRSTEIENEVSGAPVSRIVNEYAYADGFVTGRNYTLSVRNNSQVVVEVSSGRFTHKYNNDGLLSSTEILRTTVKDRNNPAGGSTIGRSTLQYEYHANYNVSKVNVDGTVYNYSETGLLTSINPSNENSSEIYTLKYQTFSKAYRVTAYVLANNRISEIAFTDNGKLKFEYDNKGQITKKTFTDPAVDFTCVEEWRYDSNNNINLLTPTFLGHPSYLKPEGAVVSNVISYTKLIFKAGSIVETQTNESTSFSQYNEQGYPLKSNLFGGDNTYTYECNR
ncbi:PKD domain-containing protein [Dyadobacter fanqingshengii]|uniref:PKD domain-containing protein n=1 Tax=Dyadobacter fanqingshengii TaxID=2906443 RepID=A0A9X1T8Z4_9BACT|nr:PKD domain-containing protein [Dyadobacter fanqingshengii]MCF0040068.1 PKD domain-containing protein [Dyadobacter fanqingshengii]USJ38180.1 PKD domain-containing protein [Dyadobacter fanqingshengii]